jgi:hypothetical protein
VSQKSAYASRGKPRDSSQEQRKYSTGNSDDGGDKDPSKRVIEKSHIVPMYLQKEKEKFQKEGQEVPEAEISPKDMEVDT